MPRQVTPIFRFIMDVCQIGWRERMSKYEGMTVMGKAQPPMPKKNEEIKLF
jgi:hypothetical protein